MFNDCPIWRIKVPGAKPFELLIPTRDEQQVAAIHEGLDGLAEPPALLSSFDQQFHWMQNGAPKPLAKEDFYGQVARQLESGTTIVQAMLAQGSENRSLHLRMAALEIAAAMTNGVEPGVAFGGHPEVFGTEEVATMNAGFRAGRSAEAFASLAKQTKSKREIGSAVTKALIQPALTLVISYGLFLVICFKVLPALRPAFARIPVLPALTRGMMWTSDILMATPVLSVLPVLAVAVLFAMRKRITTSRSFTMVADRLPFVGAYFRKGRMARMVQRLAMLLRAGVVLNEAIRLVQQSIEDPQTADALEAVEEALMDGSRASHAFTEFTLSMGRESLDLLRAIKAGEKTGDLGVEITSLGERMEAEHIEMSQMLARPMENMTTVIIGMMVGLLAYAVYVPLFDVGTAMSQ